MDQQLLRSLGIEGDLDVDSSTTKGGPGKSTLTSKLTPAPQVVFRVSDPETARALGESFGSGSRPRIQREADGASGGRDGNGVMAGAEAAVDRAASSSGAPLPTHIQRQFEGSLGADLSSVRVHTGGESQEAAHAVGAKAYTVGNDIHFAAGRYQPDDPFGMHLLAHEVAHTVQQSGGAQRRQNKLEVSTPQDAAEHEADRAADAMVRGQAATVSGASGVARATLQRDVVPDGPDETAYTKARDAGAVDAFFKEEELAKKGPVHTGDSMSYLGANNVEDRSHAIELINRIGSYAVLLTESGDETKINANAAAQEALKDYVSASADQNQAQGMFGPEFVQVQLEATRLQGMFKSHFQSAGMAEGGSTDGTTLAKQAMTAGTGKGTASAESMADTMQAQGVSSDRLKNDKLTKCKANITTLTDSLAGFAPGMSDSVQQLLAQNKAMNTAVKGLALPPVKRDASPEEAAAATEMTALKNDLAAAVATTGAVLSMAKEAVGAIPGAEKVTSAVSTGVGAWENAKTIENALTRKPGAELEKGDLTERIIKELTGYDDKMKVAKGKADAFRDETSRASARAAHDAVAAAGAVFKAAVQAYRHNRQALESIKVRLRAEVDELNRLVPSKTPGQANLGQMVGLQSQAAIFVTRCDAALRLGEQERAASKEAVTAKNRAAGGASYKQLDPDQHFGEMIAEKRGPKYYEAHKYKDMSGFGGTGGYYYKFDERQVVFSKTPRTEKGTQEAMDSSMEKKLESLAKMKEEIGLFLSQMRTMTNI